MVYGCKTYVGDNKEYKEERKESDKYGLMKKTKGAEKVGNVL